MTCDSMQRPFDSGPHYSAFLVCFALVWQTVAAPSCVRVETAVKPKPAPDIIVTVANLPPQDDCTIHEVPASGSGGPKNKHPKIPATPLIDTASLSNQSRCNIRLKDDLKLYLPSHTTPRHFSPLGVGTRRPVSTLAVFQCVSLNTQVYRSKLCLFRVIL
jgi:hypothetical protein